jgi:hypothetical protein
MFGTAIAHQVTFLGVGDGGKHHNFHGQNGRIFDKLAFHAQSVTRVSTYWIAQHKFHMAP